MGNDAMIISGDEDNLKTYRFQQTSKVFKIENIRRENIFTVFRESRRCTLAIYNQSVQNKEHELKAEEKSKYTRPLYVLVNIRSRDQSRE